jgi:hypothetical protein
VICSDRELDISLGPEDSLQLKNALARDDDLVRGLRLTRKLHLAQRQPMPVGRYRRQESSGPTPLLHLPWLSLAWLACLISGASRVGAWLWHLLSPSPRAHYLGWWCIPRLKISSPACSAASSCGC